MVPAYISISHNIFVVFNRTSYFPVEMTEKEKKRKNPKYLVNYVWRLNIMLQKYKKLMQRILGSKPMFSESNRSSNWKVYWFTDRIDG